MARQRQRRRDQAHAAQRQQPIVQVSLSRPAYRLGTAVVGTVRVTWPTPQDDVEDHPMSSGSDCSEDPTTAAQRKNGHQEGNRDCSLRDSLVALQVYAAGRCRIDPRWHQVASYVKLYGATHPNLNPRIEQMVIQQQIGGGMPTATSTKNSSTTTIPMATTSDNTIMDATSSSVVCFWATNVVELLELPERTVGKWEDVKPKPIKLHGIQQQQGETVATSSTTTTTTTKTSATVATNCNGKHHPVDPYDNEQEQEHVSLLSSSNEIGSQDKTTTTTTQSNTRKEPDEQLFFTFRIDLPDDIPPTLTAASCRYFYSVVVCATLKDTSTTTSHNTMSRSRKSGGHDETMIVVHAPLSLLLTSTTAAVPASGVGRRRKERVKIGTCVAMAHSTGLPCHLSATEIQHRHAGPMTVRRRGRYASMMSAAPSNSGNKNGNQNRNSSIPTLRVADPYGNPCCILTVIGDTMNWIPGSRVILQLDFPNQQSSRRQSRKKKKKKDDDVLKENGDDCIDLDMAADATPAPCCWIPCYQASACLTGEEVAVYEDGSKKRTRLYSLDTCHETMDPHCTQRVCLNLFLPLDCPCTVQTDLLEISVYCRIDITVGTTGDANASSYSNNNLVSSYSNLRLDLPCRVVQDGGGRDDEDDEGYGVGGGDDDDRHVNAIPLSELIFADGHDDNDHPIIDQNDKKTQRSASSDVLHLFERRDILKDLKVLSMQALDYFGP